MSVTKKMKNITIILLFCREFLYYRDQCHPTKPSFGNLLCRITNVDVSNILYLMS